jgi:hypothetical protein
LRTPVAFRKTGIISKLFHRSSFKPICLDICSRKYKIKIFRNHIRKYRFYFIDPKRNPISSEAVPLNQTVMYIKAGPGVMSATEKGLYMVHVTD